MSHRSGLASPGKPSKPRPDFPLFVHGDGVNRPYYWAKKVRGRTVYFGKCADDPHGQAAEGRWLDQKDDLLAGRTPRVENTGGVTVGHLCNRYLSEQETKVESGELSPHSFRDNKATCARIVQAFGGKRLVSDLTAANFSRFRAALSKRLGPVALGNEVGRIRSVFKWGNDEDLYRELPRFGRFKRPPKKDVRLAKLRKGPRMYESSELLAILGASKQPLKAMILLGVNCGLGNADVGRLPLSALDVDKGWLHFHREKTGIDRRCPLWPETVGAVREWLAVRPKPDGKDFAGLVFLTRSGGSWFKSTSDNPISKEFAKLLKKLNINGQRSFYALRHTFQTIGDESGDFLAVRSIMGHTGGGDIADHYRERMADVRLLKVTEYVRAWLFRSAAPPL